MIQKLNQPTPFIGVSAEVGMYTNWGVAKGFIDPRKKMLSFNCHTSKNASIKTGLFSFGGGWGGLVSLTGHHNKQDHMY